MVVVGVVDMVDDESVAVLSPLPLAARSELHPAATDAMIAVIKAKLKNCFFIGFRYLLNLITGIILILFKLYLK
ncbi:hypothetical protein GCM10011425_19240 [Mucilaginibacter galii]|uniref:Uncharacterized protein n=1 Tax=Mucilaginibacter galii TaxID=2005073 RepID=A0A917J9Q7_9SPHI|nr:hypothetical protein GCM10011425_19240 [Mucilaginibacter galii]